MDELTLLERLIPKLPTQPSVIVGAGDDCAVLDLGLTDRFVLFKTDAIVEGVHFTREVDPQRIGRKALARCLSDVAAMGGHPRHAVVTLGLPRDFELEFVEQVYAGLNALAGQFEVAVVGGETTVHPGHVFISVSLIGDVLKNRYVRRAGAEVGDGIFVTGMLGGSREGKHLDFEPRIREALWLTEHFPVHAMIDLSDGLARDLRHILKASGVGAELRAQSIPISRAARSKARAALPPDLADGSPAGFQLALKSALTDGEDFELLFTVPSREAVKLLDQWKAAFSDLPLTCIGKIMAGSHLLIQDKETVRPLVADGYIHFA